MKIVKFKNEKWVVCNTDLYSKPSKFPHFIKYKKYRIVKCSINEKYGYGELEIESEKGNFILVEEITKKFGYSIFTLTLDDFMTIREFRRNKIKILHSELDVKLTN